MTLALYFIKINFTEVYFEVKAIVNTD